MTTRLLLILILAVAAPAAAQSPPAGDRGSVSTVLLPVPGTTTSVDSLAPSVVVQGPFAGSASSLAAVPFNGRLSLREAIARGLQFNLGAMNAARDADRAHEAARFARGSFLPQVAADVSGARRVISLAANGISFSVPALGIELPTVVGPFNVIDARVGISQTVFDLPSWLGFQAARRDVDVSEWAGRDARDLVVLAVGGEYLQVLAGQARLTSANTQLATARAVQAQSAEQRRAGLLAQIDVNRTDIQVLTEEQRLVALEADLARHKIALARLTGLSPADDFEIDGDVPFSAAPSGTLEEATAEALRERTDLKAAEAALAAAEARRAAARAGHLPSLAVGADYGAIGPAASDARATYTVAATVHVPLWDGGRTSAEVGEAEALVQQRRAEIENARGQVVADVRNAWLLVHAAASQIDLARANRETSQQTLDLARQRFEAGITDSIEVVRAEDTLAAADLDVINSILAHNTAKLALARALGAAESGLHRFLVFK